MTFLPLPRYFACMEPEIPDAEIQFHVARATERRAALRLVMTGLDPGLRENQVEQSLRTTPEEGFRDLWVATKGTTLLAAVWGVLQDGNTAFVWPPRAVTSEENSCCVPLLKHLLQSFDEQHIDFAQSLLEPIESDAAAAALTAAGFRREAELLYLVSMVGYVEMPDADRELQFHPVSSAHDESLEAVIVRTYVDSRDFPSLNGRREIAEVISGYAATGVFDPARWLIVHFRGKVAGVLLLTDHPDQDQWELLYMGLVPEARGQGLGIKIVGHAMRETCFANRDRLVLAVDAENEPAKAMYDACGFLVWDRRFVFLRWK
jgi:ribosomal protein S18 acetylase RimI-like enzyme